MERFFISEDEYEYYVFKNRSALNGIYEVENCGIFYWKDGLLHREDGPAKIHPNGDSSWYYNDEHHRLDGPAICWSCRVEYWIHGERFDNLDEYYKVSYMLKNNLENYM